MSITKWIMMILFVSLFLLTNPTIESDPEPPAPAGIQGPSPAMTCCMLGWPCCG